jgi:hypothetical protein
MTLRNFSLGKVLIMPDSKPDQTHLVDADVARYFFETEHYYAAAIQRIEATIRELETVLDQPWGGDGP